MSTVEELIEEIEEFAKKAKKRNAEHTTRFGVLFTPDMNGSQPSSEGFNKDEDDTLTGDPT